MGDQHLTATSVRANPVSLPHHVSLDSRRAVIPLPRRSSAGLEPYSGPWTDAQVLHLLRRTTFGPSPDDVGTLMPLGLSGALDLLLSPQPPETSVPLIVDQRDVAPIGQSWIDLIYMDTAIGFNPAEIRRNSLKAWWFGLMLGQRLSLREKMVLFWHNHFATSAVQVGDPRYDFRLFAMLREHALGNFRDLAQRVSTDGAMLRYLNGNTSTKGSPNENYARELQELFTIGKGPEVAPGDYTNYTEADVKAAARVLTGWQDEQNDQGIVEDPSSIFNAPDHDPLDKQFSSRYQNRVIRGGPDQSDGPRELGELLDMIFAQPATAAFICRKLYRWFVHFAIDDSVEANVITPLADLLRAGSYEVAPVLRALLGSAHFFDPLNAGAMIKSPVDYTAGLCRMFSPALPSDLVLRYGQLFFLDQQAASMNMDVGDPPNVAGWPAYYQTPDFDKIWINTDTLPKRGVLAATLVSAGHPVGDSLLAIDPVAVVERVSDPSDPNVLIDELARLMYPVALNDAQKTYLKDVLIPGLPDYEWGTAWAAYRAAPQDPQIRNAVLQRLQRLLMVMLSMPEFQIQ